MSEEDGEEDERRQAGRGGALIPVVFVGINPGNARLNSKTASVRKLETWCDVLGLRHYGFVNCIPDLVGHGYKMSMVDYDFLARCVEGQAVVALGRFPSRALERIGVRHFRLPHPSGLNRVLNDPAVLPPVLAACKIYIKTWG